MWCDKVGVWGLTEHHICVAAFLVASTVTIASIGAPDMASGEVLPQNRSCSFAPSPA